MLGPVEEKDLILFAAAQTVDERGDRFGLIARQSNSCSACAAMDLHFCVSQKTQ